ncbi:MAG: Hpt domain-containing protein [Gammaproteobacteria bacterium]|nr:Hpt domain-containing protein [Gammaproteobacteria bacterium]
MTEQIQKTLDQDTIAQLRADMGEDFGELILVFIESCKEILAALELAFDSRDLAVFLRQAHSLKSSSANLGGMLLSRQAAALELDAKSGKLPDSDLVISSLRAEFARIETELTRLLTEV